MTELLLGVIVLLQASFLLAGGVGAYRVRRTLRALRDDVARLRYQLTNFSRPASEAAPAGEKFRELEQRLVDALSRSTQPLKQGKQSVEQRTRRAVAQDMHAIATLHSAFPLAGESLPYTSFAASPDTVLHLTTLVADLPDGARVVEFGSGLSTVYMAAAAKNERRDISILSIDHDPIWGKETEIALARHGLGDVAKIRVAPLEDINDGAVPNARWFGSSGTEDARNVALVVVDGPPASTGRKSRYPAVPRLIDRLATGARIVLDDTDREDERQIVEDWLQLLSPERAPVVERVLERTTVIRLDAGSAADRA